MIPAEELDKTKDLFEQELAKQHKMDANQRNGVCPGCGRCPICGRRDYPYYPYWPMPNPWRGNRPYWENEDIR